MRLNDFFHRDEIIREKEFLFTYAKGKNLLQSIAYSENANSIRHLNSDETISVVITSILLAQFVSESKGLVICDQPKLAFYKLHNILTDQGYIKPLNPSFIHPSARIASTAIINENVYIGKNVVIGEYTILESNTFIGDNCKIGHRVIIGANSILNSLVNGTLYHVSCAGGVKIGDRSQIINGATIQKPYQAFYTEIGQDIIIGTNVIIGHGSTIGDRTMISGDGGMAGNCNIGSDVWIGTSATISDGISVGNKAQIKIGSIVVKNVKENEVVSGNFALNHKTNLRNQVQNRY